MTWQEPDRPQHAVLVGALAHPHSDRVAQDQHHDQQDDDTDDVHRAEDRSEHAHEAVVQGPFTHADGLDVAFVEARVDFLGNLCSAPRVVDTRCYPPDLILTSRREAFVQIVPMEEERSQVDGTSLRVVNCRDFEVPVAGIDGASNLDSIAWLPTELLGEHASNHDTLAVVEERLLLFFGNVYFVVHLEEGIRVDRNRGEELVVAYGVFAAEPR